MNRLKDQLRFRRFQKQEYEKVRQKKLLNNLLRKGTFLGAGTKYVGSLILLFGLIFLYYHTTSSILHYPETISWITYFVSLAGSLLVYRKAIMVNIEESKFKIKIVAYVLEAIGRIAISVMPTLVLKSLICLYLLHLAPKEKEEILLISIESISYYSKYQRYNIHFQLEGENESIETQSEVVKTLHQSKSYRHHQIQLKVRRSLWGTYVLESWRIQ